MPAVGTPVAPVPTAGGLRIRNDSRCMSGLLQASDSNGHANLAIQIPADVGLLHQRVLAQAVVLHPDKIAFISNATSSVLN